LSALISVHTMGYIVDEKPILINYDYLSTRPQGSWIKMESNRCHCDKPTDWKRSAHPCVTRNSHIQIGLRTSKRPHAEESDVPDVTQKSTSKRSRNEDASHDNSAGKKKGQVARIRCPENVRDPKQHRQHACRGKGFADMGKLK
jgi:hypothetical protein